MMECTLTKCFPASGRRCAGNGTRSALGLTGAILSVIVTAVPLGAIQADTLRVEDPFPCLIEVSPERVLRGDWVLGGVSDVARTGVAPLSRTVVVLG